MGKASTRRHRNRRKRLRQEALESPDRFVQQWRLRLGSWCEEIEHLGGRLWMTARSPGGGAPRPICRSRRCFEVMERALRLADDCGGRDVPMVWGRYQGTVYSVTQDVLTHACQRALARAVDPALHRLGSADRVCRRLSRALRRVRV